MAATDFSSDRMCSDGLFSTSNVTHLPSATHNTTRGSTVLSKNGMILKCMHSDSLHTQVYVHKRARFPVFEEYKLHIRILELNWRQLLFHKLSTKSLHEF